MIDRVLYTPLKRIWIPKTIYPKAQTLKFSRKENLPEVAGGVTSLLFKKLATQYTKNRVHLMLHKKISLKA